MKVDIASPDVGIISAKNTTVFLGVKQCSWNLNLATYYESTASDTEMLLWKSIVFPH